MFKFHTTLICIFFLLLGASCRKDNENPCTGKLSPEAQFGLFETVGDTIFEADTVFRDNYVQFKALTPYDSVKWKLGNDPRTFTKNFNLSFHTFLGSIPISFTGKKAPEKMCFPQDNGTYQETRRLTVLEQFERGVLTISPLIGKYQGYFTNAPKYTFTVRIEYFDNPKYNPSAFGGTNFYWISNIPKGYFWPHSSQTFSYPELQHGKELEMGYKGFVFGSATCDKGKGWLSNDSLYINYGSDG